jgi:hypothetical protein
MSLEGLVPSRAAAAPPRGVMRALFNAPKKVTPARVIAYDAKGREVHRIDINPGWFRID